MRNFSTPHNRSASQHGSVTIIVAVSLVVLLGFAALGVDIGYVFYNQKRLQAATDAAALAGGQDLWVKSWATAQADATSYSATGGKYNALPSGITVQAATITGLQLASVALPYGQAVSGYNGIKVTQTATVPLFFGQFLGIKTVNISATSTAGAGGGGPPPLNVVIVLDTTASMSSPDASCSAGTKIGCALLGAQSLMSQLSSAGDNVGLVVFPPFGSSTAAGNAVCGSSTSVPYAGADSSSNVSTIAGLTNSSGSSGYMSSGKLNTSSTLVQAVGGKTGCNGLQAVGGQGTYFAQAVNKAQSLLHTLSSTNGEQNVMIILSDGDASSGSFSGAAPSHIGTDECQQAIVAANNAKTAGTWVYVVGYGVASGGCSTDTTLYGKGNVTGYTSTTALTGTKNITACHTLQTMAGNAANYSIPSPASSYFYADSSSTGCASPNPSNGVSTLFTDIGSALLGTRLLPDNAT
jgi:Flp pilus assembly protein TadG